MHDNSSAQGAREEEALEASVLELKKTEEDAARALEAARHKREEVLLDARKEVERISEQTLVAVKAAKDKVYKEGNVKIDKEVQEILSKAQKEGAALVTKSKPRVSKAADAVVGRLFK